MTVCYAWSEKLKKAVVPVAELTCDWFCTIIILDISWLVDWDFILIYFVLCINHNQQKNSNIQLWSGICQHLQLNDCIKVHLCKLQNTCIWLYDWLINRSIYNLHGCRYSVWPPAITRPTALITCGAMSNLMIYKIEYGHIWHWMSLIRPGTIKLLCSWFIAMFLCS